MDAFFGSLRIIVNSACPLRKLMIINSQDEITAGASIRYAVC